MDSGTGWNGCYATHIVIRKGTHTVKLPDNVPDKIGATLNCALASMTNAVEPLMDLANLAEKREENKNKTVLVQVSNALLIRGIIVGKPLSSTGCIKKKFTVGKYSLN